MPAMACRQNGNPQDALPCPPGHQAPSQAGETMVRENSLNPDQFMFRGLHPAVSVGTASDRYAGWLGQIYSPERYGGEIQRRTKKIGRHSFIEETLPVESVAEYFEHFRVLEIDYTFYSTLLNEAGEPSRSYHVLASYCRHLQENDHLILKVPQIVSAQKILRGSSYRSNELYLNPELFLKQFYQPALDLAGANLRGFIFEQEYQRKDDRVPAARLAAELDAFFSAIPADRRYHIELRTASYLVPEVLAVLEKHGIGQVLSHWTWLPPLEKQLAQAENRFFNAGKQVILRLMTPLGTRYQDAYRQAHPFDKLVPGLLQPAMIESSARLMWTASRQGMQINILINNRAGGNAPLIAQQLARRFLALAPQIA